MGVRGLTTFIQKFCPPDCFPQVSIEQLVEDFRSKTGQTEPVIVFHASNVGRYLLKDVDWLCGGQHQEAMSKIRAFVSAFQKLGVHPVFFFQGYSNEDAENFERTEWIEKGRSKLNRVNKLFDELEGEDFTPNIDPRSSAPSLETLSYYFSLMDGCEVHKATMECNKDIVLYTRANPNCIAIFAEDSDFIIHNGAKYYLSAENFEIETMKTHHYNREGLANRLGLALWQLPLLGTLGNHQHYTSFDELLPFFNRLYGGRTGISHRFPALAHYIRRKCFNAREPFEEAIIGILPRVATDVYNDAQKANILAVSVRCFTSIQESSPLPLGDDPSWNEILIRADELHRTNKLPTIVRKLLNNQPIECLVELEDLRGENSTTRLPPSSRITRRLRQKLYGILLSEKPFKPEPHFVTEYCIEGLSGTCPLQVEVIPPQGEHPRLLELWGDDRSERMQNIRWKLFTGAISSCLEPIELINLDDNLVLPTASLFYLWEYEEPVVEEDAQEKIFQIWEMNALIATIVMLNQNPADQVDSPVNPIDPRAIHMASIFNRTLRTVMDILAFCGYPLEFERTFAHPYFDGKLFQRKYQEAKNEASCSDLCEQEDFLTKFNNVRDIVFKMV